MHKSIAVVGGVPNPIGGVTTFVRRLIVREQGVTHLFDLYPSGVKMVPNAFVGNFICHSRKLLTVLRLFIFCLQGKVSVLHFNFSTPRSLLLLAVLPKINAKWFLMLHHGDLEGGINPFVKWVLSSRVDAVLCLNARQAAWYSRFVEAEKIKMANSYVEPFAVNPDFEFVQRVSGIVRSAKKVIVCSGYPTEIYNHLMAISVMGERQEDVLLCCLYGPGGLREQIVSHACRFKNVHIMESLSEDNFNYLLSIADLYLRVNTEDSFGIAVADAINFGVRVIATAVCERYAGCFLISSAPTFEEVLGAVKDVLDGDGVSLQRSHVEKESFSYERLDLG